MADNINDDIKEDKPGESKDELQMTAAEERTRYFKKLEKWLHEAYAWQSMAAIFPYYLMSGQIINSSSGVPLFPSQVSNVGNTHRLIVGTNDQENDSLRQRRPQDHVGPLFQPPGAEGRRS
ncbi:hypothetical protein WN48_11225 [Eufriesea mexicana]|uniref:Uncharacterized protein n=1 Tax=Eufriesea mexicana TaxID=516756 RepID=A0A310SHU7_9HYME|nr:hypothetical protein WN48_11225 [Eufriesea mexicana]